MSEFDVQAYLEAIETPRIKMNGKRYDAKVLSVEEWMPFQVRMIGFLNVLKDAKEETVENLTEEDMKRFSEISDDWNNMRRDFFTALFGHLKNRWKPWTWFRPDLIVELEALPNRDLVFQDFFELRAGATNLPLRKTNGTS